MVQLVAGRVAVQRVAPELNVTVPVAATDKPFVAGKAFAQASFFDCGPTICSQTNATRSVTLQVKKKK